jgi:hypothetical protein
MGQIPDSPAVQCPGTLTVMETALAIYEALIQANVPPPAARRVADSLERDMSSSLATKQDLQHLEQLMAARFETVESRFDAIESRFTGVDGSISALESRVVLMMENLESRVVIKLGALMTILFGVVGAIVALLR